LLTILIKVIPIKIDNAIVSVKIMCEVIVKPYGSKPKKFDAKIKLNKKNTIGKYLRTSRLEI
jgi:ribosome maturation protein Sdo1